MFSIPIDLCSQILSFIEPRELCNNVTTVSKLFYKAVDMPATWKYTQISVKPTNKPVYMTRHSPSLKFVDCIDSTKFNDALQASYKIAKKVWSTRRIHTFCELLLKTCLIIFNVCGDCIYLVVICLCLDAMIHCLPVWFV